MISGNGLTSTNHVEVRGHVIDALSPRLRQFTLPYIQNFWRCFSVVLSSDAVNQELKGVTDEKKWVRHEDDTKNRFKSKRNNNEDSQQNKQLNEH